MTNILKWLPFDESQPEKHEQGRDKGGGKFWQNRGQAILCKIADRQFFAKLRMGNSLQNCGWAIL
jgi:hypothetical protein